MAQQVKNPLANAGDTGDAGSIPGSRRSPGGRNGSPLQNSCLENPMDRGGWQATILGVAKSWTRPSDSHGEGNGNPLQYSCLENPRDRGACWAAVYGVAQSQTLLTRLSSSSRVTHICTYHGAESGFNHPVSSATRRLRLCKTLIPKGGGGPGRPQVQVSCTPSPPTVRCPQPAKALSVE